MNRSKALEAIVSNMQYAWLPRVITELVENELRDTHSMLASSQLDGSIGEAYGFYLHTKTETLLKALADEDQVDFLVNLPKWLGFKFSAPPDLISARSVFDAAIHSVMSTLWTMMISRNMVYMTVTPEELDDQGIEEIVTALLFSDRSRQNLESMIREMIRTRGANVPSFEVQNVLQGYDLEHELASGRIPYIIAMVLMSGTELPIDIDIIVHQKVNDLIKETVGYIKIMHLLSFLRNAIEGSGSRRPFDWPLIGDRKTYGQIISIAKQMQSVLRGMKSGNLLLSEFAAIAEEPSNRALYMYAVEEIAAHYSDLLKAKRGRGITEELSSFIDLIRSQKFEIAQEVVKSPNEAEAIHRRIQQIYSQAKKGYKPYVSPEKRFKTTLESIEARLKIRWRSEEFESLLIDRLKPLFDTAGEIILHHQTELGEDINKFAEGLCFETSLRILASLGIEHLLFELPWISRFIAEEATEAYALLGIYDSVREEHKIERIMAAYLGGLAYLILQHRKEEAKPDLGPLPSIT